MPTVRRAWRFRRYFLPFLGPAVGLLLVAFVQADLLFLSTAAMSRVVDALAAAVHGDQSPSGPDALNGPNGPNEAAPGVAGSRFSFEPVLLTPFVPTTGTPAARAIRLAALMALFLVLADAVNLGREYLRTRLNERFRYRVQRDLLGALAREPAETRTRRQGGVTNEIFANDTSGLASLLVFGLIGIGESVVQVGKFSYEIVRVSDLRLLAIVLALSVFTQGGLARFFLGPESRLIERSQELVMHLRARSMQLFDNLDRLVYFRGEAREMTRVLDATVAANEANRGFMMLSNVRGTLSGLLTQLTFPILVLLLLLYGGGIVDPGRLLGAERIVMMLAAAVAALAATPAMLMQYAPGLRRLEDVLSIPEPAAEPAALHALRAAATGGTPPAIRLRDVSFRYAGSRQLLLQGVDLDVPAGARVGIVGRSGCGKSTLARLLIGDVRPETGRMLLNDVDVTAWHLWWRREVIGFLPAEQGFLPGTLEENVLFGRSRDAVRDLGRALELSGVAQIAREKAADGGLAFALHNPTAQLSSGQRRRVGIARLLAGDQPVWIFDEPGSQLDPRAMLDVAEAIASASAGHTTLIITHDPDVFVTDFNVLLRDGRVDDVGTHEELLARNGHYFDLVNKNVADRREHGTGGAPTFPPSLPVPGGAPPGGPPGGPGGRSKKVPIGVAPSGSGGPVG